YLCLCVIFLFYFFFFFSSRRRHTRCLSDWSSDVCSSDLMSLSIKELEPNAWNDFIASHNPGDVVKGKIARFASFGAFVELGDNRSEERRVGKECRTRWVTE